ncbi:DNA excision repair protein ERCC-6, variant 2, partial [Bonamia ostreae]
MKRRRGLMYKAIDKLRKICNHVDLYLHDNSVSKNSKSCKLNIMNKIISIWKEENHRVLIFSQTIQMLNIIEEELKTFSYFRLDGSTPICARQKMINRFNEDESIFCFLLTTRTGGLGLNLIGADRVLLFDPDWNPSIDNQAVERSFRIGQKKEVVVYRLITKGTIEEKVYHRQIYKQLLSNRILEDARQNGKQLFSKHNLANLFDFCDDDEDLNNHKLPNFLDNNKNGDKNLSKNEKNYDKNGDKNLSKNEKNYDKNGDKNLSKNEKNYDKNGDKNLSKNEKNYDKNG